MKIPRAGLCVAALVLLALPVLPGAETQPNDDSLKKYTQVLDLVFPTDWCDRHPEGNRFAMEQITVRVLPSFWQESQIVICTWPNGKAFLVHSTLPASDGMAWTPVIRELMGQREPRSAEAIAAAFHPVHESCAVDPAVIDDWSKQLRSMRFDVPNEGGLDGITYEITLQRGTSEIRAKVWGPDKKCALISWVEKVRTIVSKSSCKETEHSDR